MRDLIIEWIYNKDNHNKYTFESLENMTDEELMKAHNDIVYDLIRDS